MLRNYAKRSLAFLMALIMVFSLVPGSVFATDAPAEEVHDHDHDHDHQDEVTEVTEATTPTVPAT